MTGPEKSRLVNALFVTVTMFLALAAAAASLTCASPIPPDGASLACGHDRTVRIHGIIVPAPLDTCKSWDVLCRPDPGSAARDHLADLTRGLAVDCQRRADGQYRCAVAGRDLACAMVADGFARPQPDLRHCPPPPPRARVVDRDLIPPLWAIGTFLALVNLAGIAAVAFDEYRQRRGFGALTDRLLVLLALFGGGAGIIATQMSVARQNAGISAGVAVVLGLQIGAILGVLFI